MVNYSLHDCSGVMSSNEIHPIEYKVFGKLASPDSIIFTIHMKLSYIHEGMFRDQVQYVGSPTNASISYLKNDADSIVFSFHFYDWVQEWDRQVPINDPCRLYNDSEDFSGTARILTSNAAVSISENNTLSVELFPNPTNEILKIKAKNSKVTVIDNLGRIVIYQTSEADALNGSMTLDVSSLPAGCYTLLLTEGSKKVTGRFIKY
jgi:hypothetical protein